MVKAVILDAEALNLLQQGSELPPSWPNDFLLPDDHPELISIVKEDSICILPKSTQAGTRCLIIKLQEGKLFSGIDQDHRLEAFERCVKAALSIFEPTINIPVHWKPWNRGSVLSFQSNSRSSGETARILLDRSPIGSGHAYAFDLTERQQDFAHAQPDYDLFIDAASEYEGALSSLDFRSSTTTDRKRIVDLSGRLPQGFTYGLTLDDWYKSKLTKRQREFVDFEMNQSVRLRGAAGTGKTIALIIKFIHEIYKRDSAGEKYRFVFLTHSWATAELIRSIISVLDERDVLARADNDHLVLVTTLLDLANRAIAYDLHNLTPLSVDGLEGRTLQMEVLASVLQSYRNSVWITRRGPCTEPFRKFIEAPSGSPAQKLFCWEILNEFACVLDAEGVRDSRERRERYLSERRRNWMMRLENVSEREVILELYTEFRRELREMKAVGVDQMISDFLGYLDSFRWDAVRHTEGYDAVFVDELHLFNRQERMAFHHLMRDASSQPIVLMAYDAKQSPRDTFVGLEHDEVEQYNFWRDAKLGKVERIELQEVFRYTPQIGRVLHHIDQSFPAADLEEEWVPFQGRSQLADGPLPLACVLKDSLEQYKVVFERASEAAQRLGSGRRVAVLSMSYDGFELYLKAMNFRDRFVAIQSREQFSEIAHAGKRFIYSMPEFIAGLQFDAVFLIDVNDGDLSNSANSIGAKRRFASLLYLGASRAAQVLEVYARSDMGGLAEPLKLAIKGGAMSQVDVASVPRVTEVLAFIKSGKS